MPETASVKLCILWYIVLICFLGLFTWRKFRFQQRPLLLSPWIFFPLVAGITALLTSLLGYSLIALALELACGIILGFVHPIFAASFFLSTFLIKPWELLPQSALLSLLPRSLAALAFASLLVHLARHRSKHIFFNTGALFFAGFMLWIFVSALTASNSTASLAFFGSAILPIIATFLLIVNASNEKLDFEIIRGGLVISILTLVSIPVLHFFWTWNFDFNSTLPALESPWKSFGIGDLASLIVLSIPLIFFPLVNRSRSNWNRTCGFGLVVFLLLTLILFSNNEFRSVKATSVISNQREHFVVALSMLKTNPISGVGVNNYSELYDKYSRQAREPRTDYQPSSWIIALAETGIPGASMLLALFLFVIYRAYLFRAFQPEQLIAALSYGLCMSFLSHAYLLVPYVLFAWILSTKKIIASSSEI